MKKKTKRQQAISNRRAGRQNERELAERMGFILQGLYGKQDAMKDIFSAEFKKVAKYRGATFMKQAVANAAKGKKPIPLLVVHVTGQRRENDIVHIRLKDWMRIQESILHAVATRYSIKKKSRRRIE